MTTMRLLMCVTVAGLVAGPASAQSSSVRSFSVVDVDRARIGIVAGAEAGRLDVAGAIDSRLLGAGPFRAGFGGWRFRASLGHGRWEDDFASRGPLSTEPRVTRVAGLVMFETREGTFSGRLGLGLAAYVPHHPALTFQHGLTLVAGMGYSGERWSVGPELEVDAPKGNLLPTARLGIAVKRHF